MKVIHQVTFSQYPSAHLTAFFHSGRKVIDKSAIKPVIAGQVYNQPVERELIDRMAAGTNTNDSGIRWKMLRRMQNSQYSKEQFCIGKPLKLPVASWAFHEGFRIAPSPLIFE